jgi:hypothetical protein
MQNSIIVKLNQEIRLQLKYDSINLYKIDISNMPEIIPESLCQESLKDFTQNIAHWRAKEYHNSQMSELDKNISGWEYMINKIMVGGKFDTRPIGRYELQSFTVDRKRKAYIAFALLNHEAWNPSADLYVQHLRRLIDILQRSSGQNFSIEQIIGNFRRSVALYHNAILKRLEEFRGFPSTGPDLGIFFEQHPRIYFGLHFELDKSKGNFTEYEEVLGQLSDLLNTDPYVTLKRHLICRSPHTTVITITKWNLFPLITNVICGGSAKALMTKSDAIHCDVTMVKLKNNLCNLVHAINSLEDKHGFEILVQDENEANTSNVGLPTGLHKLRDSIVGGIQNLAGAVGIQLPTQDKRPKMPIKTRDETDKQFRKKLRQHKRDLNAWRQRQRDNNRDVDSDDEVEESSADEPELEEEHGHDDAPPLGEELNEEDDPLHPHQPQQPHQPQPQPQQPEPVAVPTSDEPVGPPEITGDRMTNLLFRARPMIRQYRDAPNDNAGSQHRIRFGITNDEPQTINSTDVNVNDGDMVVNACNSINSIRFLLTFAGTDQHPVFNKIRNTRWTRWA